MRRIGLVVVAALAACRSGDDDRTLRPPGGGGDTGNEEGPDAGAQGGGGAGDLVTGRVCVVLDLDAPFACPAIALARDVQVADVGGESTFSDDTGAFSLPASSATLTLSVGGESGDALFETWTRVARGDDVDAPAVDEVLFEDTLFDLGEVLSDGAMLVYVRDPDGPVAGATVTLVGGSPGARIYYDDGVGGFDLGAVTTGPDGIALVLDTGGATARAEVDGRAATTVIDTGTQVIGLGTITLAAP